MITICMDTSHKWLAIAVIKDDEVIAEYQDECWKQQSEELFPRLIELTDQCGLQPEDIDAMVISKGPGSYTGVRIAMTVAKVFCAMRNIPIYTISTLQLYAGKNTCRVIMDARGKRVYTCAFEDGNAVEEERAMLISDLEISEELVIGDGYLVGKDTVIPDIAANFRDLKDHWVKEDQVHLVVPEYLKPSDSYMVNKNG